MKVYKEKMNYLPFPGPTPSTGINSVIQFGVYPFTPFSMLIKSYAIIISTYMVLLSFCFILYIYILHLFIIIPHFSSLHLLVIVA